METDKPSPDALQFFQADKGQGRLLGYIDENAKWTCNTCGSRASDVGCTHLLQFLRDFAKGRAELIRPAEAYIRVYGGPLSGGDQG